MWAKQQCDGAGEPEKGETQISKAHCTFKYILKLSLLICHAPAIHRKWSAKGKQVFLTATGTPKLPATAETEQEVEVKQWHMGAL